MEKKYSLLVGESSHQLTKGWNIVGRSTMNDQHNTVLLDDESICPQHAVISWHENDTFKIIDLCTKSGTSINNETIKSLYWQDVPIDASIKFGSVESYLRICSEQNACLNTSVDTSDQEFVSCSPGLFSDRYFFFGMTQSIELQHKIAPVYFYFYQFKLSYGFGEALTQSKDNLGICHGEDVLLIYKTPLHGDNFVYTNDEADMTNKLLNMYETFSCDNVPRFGENTLLKATGNLKYLDIIGPETVTTDETKPLFDEEFWNDITVDLNDD